MKLNLPNYTLLIVAFILQTGFTANFKKEHIEINAIKAGSPSDCRNEDLPSEDIIIAADPIFESFLKQFITQTISGKNFDSLVYVSSPQILKFADVKNLGFGRFWNMGIYCSLYESENFGYNFYDGYFGDLMPHISHLKFYAEKSPEDGFCEEASSPDGIYYQLVSELPEDYDIENDHPIPAPAKFKSLKKMRVDIQHNQWVIQSFYFIEYNAKWYLLYIQDCDCGA